MKQLLIISALLFLFVGCNVSENKEARIRKLESHVEQTTNRLQEIENRIQALESNDAIVEE